MFLLNYIFLTVILLLSGCNSKIKPHYNIKDYKKAFLISEECKTKIEKKNKYYGHYKIGKPYALKGVKYYPKKYKKYEALGTASWYQCEYDLPYCYTANQDIFQKDLLTAAHTSLPLPSIVKVTNLENNISLIVMVNDRGPYLSDKGDYPKNENRIIDLSPYAAELLGFKRSGKAKVKISLMTSETLKLYNKLSLPAQENKYPIGSIKQPKCDLRKYLLLLNMKYKFLDSKITRISYRPYYLNL